MLAQSKNKAGFVVLALSSICVGLGLDDLDPCIRSCYVDLLGSVGCSGTPEMAALCGCSDVEHIWFKSPLTQCAENNCSTSDLPTALTSSGSCKAFFAILFRTNSKQLPAVTLRSQTTSSSGSNPSISTNTPANAPTNVLLDTRTIVQASTPTSTPTSTSTTRPTSSPTDAQTSTRSGIASTDSLINTPKNVLDSTTASSPIGTPTTTPLAYPESPTLSPGVISGIVIVAVGAMIGIIGAMWCYRRRSYSRETPVEVNNATTQEEKGIEPVVPGYNELLGSTAILHELESSPPQKSQPTEGIEVISEIDSDPYPKRPEVLQLQTTGWSVTPRVTIAGFPQYHGRE